MHKPDFLKHILKSGAQIIQCRQYFPLAKRNNKACWESTYLSCVPISIIKKNSKERVYFILQCSNPMTSLRGLLQASIAEVEAIAEAIVEAIEEQFTVLFLMAYLTCFLLQLMIT